MHCRACNKLLTDYQATLKNAVTGQYMDLCKVCLEDIKPFVKLIDRKDLITEADLDEIEDDTDTTVSLEAEDIIIDYVVDYREDYDDR
jgi:hypothetical protein